MRYINKIVYIIILFSLVIFQPNAGFAKGDKEGKRKPNLPKVTGTPSATWFTINNVNTIIRNNGDSDLNGTDSGFEYPAGANKTIFFESGFVYGGLFQGEWRLGGSAYEHSQQPGRILDDGTAENTELEHVRIYKVRRDYLDPDADLSRDVLKDERSLDQVIAQYKLDWEQWPWQYGAPYEDVNGNGIYEHNIDIPGVPGADQTIWFVNNDLDPSLQQKFYGTLGMGMEMQATFWGYNSGGALGNAMFRKYQMINKGGENIDSMYVCMWSDPDLGDAGDDYTGCDTTLSLGFIYNGDDADAQYGANVPAGGFDFFQGPIVPGLPTDEAIFKGAKRPGYKNLPMSSFFFFINSDAVYRDPVQGDPVGARQWRNLFEGKVSTTGVPFADPNTGIVTKFTLSGDPYTGRGWVDGILHRPNDRRFGMVAGPFNFAAGDTQEVVVGQFAAGGTTGITRLGAVGLLKFYDLELQLAYNSFFKVPPPVKPPAVTAVALDGKISLRWGDRTDVYPVTESYDTLGYVFQGYCIYQMPTASATIEDALLVETYDLNDLIGSIESTVFDATTSTSTKKFTKFGRNTGIKRYITVEKDLVRSGVPIVNGTHYYFAVTAYAYNPNPEAVPNVLETPLAIFDILPQSPNPGVNYSSEAEDMIDVSHSGTSDGVVTPIVVDPTTVTGHNYKVTFANVDDQVLWSLTDVTTNTVKVSNQVQNQGDVSPMLDGFLVKVAGPSAGIKSNSANAAAGIVEVAYAGQALTSAQYDAAGAPFKGNAVWHGLNSAQTERYYISGGGGTGLSRITRSIANTEGYDFSMIFTDGTSDWGAWGFDAGEIGHVPFQLWRYDQVTGDSVRLLPFLYTGGAGDPGVFKAKYPEDWQSGGYLSSDWIYWYYDSHGYDAFAAACAAGDVSAANNFGEIEYFSRVTIADFDGNGTLVPPGTIIRFYMNAPNSPADVFSFTAPSVSYSADQAKVDIEQINVFPNPYYGVNPREVNKYQKYVTISHLPQKATIRIFNLAGQLVTTIKKDDTSPFTLWNLSNDANLPVASGLYILHVDMPDLGATKILKVAIIQEQQILDRF